jgi:hypothetical protein
MSNLRLFIFAVVFVGRSLSSVSESAHARLGAELQRVIEDRRYYFEVLLFWRSGTVPTLISGYSHSGGESLLTLGKTARRALILARRQSGTSRRSSYRSTRARAERLRVIPARDVRAGYGHECLGLIGEFEQPLRRTYRDDASLVSVNDKNRDMDVANREVRTKPVEHQPTDRQHAVMHGGADEKGESSTRAAVSRVTARGIATPVPNDSPNRTMRSPS